MTDEAAIERVPTGIPGLDPLLEGGLLRGGVYMIQGPPGAGKTILGNQMAFHHAARGGSAVYLTLLAESHTRMLGHMRRMRFFDPAVIPDRVHYVSAFKTLEGEGLDGLLATVRRALAARAATFLVLDGLVSAEEASPSPKDFKKFIHGLQTIAAMSGCTTMLLSSTERASPFRPEQTMVDGIIELSDQLDQLRSLRRVQVRKMRGTAPVRGQHTVEISDDGIMVRPRLESQIRPDITEDMPARTERIGFGVDGLDRMLKGGLRRGSNTMLLGPTGCGKTILGMQFLAAGARLGEPGVYFGFYERPPVLLMRSQRIKLGLEEAVRDGLIELVWQRPVEGIIDALAERLIEAVRRTRARRVCIDGMHGFQVSIDSPERIREVFAALIDDLERLGVTTVYTLETPDLFGSRIEIPVSGVTSVTNNVIMMRHVEMNAQLHRLISIVKLRDSDYESGIREFRITDQGVEVADTFASARQILTGTAQPGAVHARPLRRVRGTRPRGGRRRDP